MTKKATSEQQPSRLSLLIPYAGMITGALFLVAMVYVIQKISKIRRITHRN